jgi:hypothetical protein
MTNRRYSKADKIAAVVAAEMTNATAAGEATGIPERNIRRWQDDPELAEYVGKTRDELGEVASTLAHLAGAKLLEAVRLGKLEPRDLLIAFGLAVDKSQLLTGGATGRTEHRSITDDLNDDEKRRLRDWIDGLPTAAAAEGAAG